MPKYRITALAGASWVIGEYEAATPNEADDMAMNDQAANDPRLCHHCAHVIDLGDVYKTDIFEID